MNDRMNDWLIDNTLQVTELCAIHAINNKYFFIRRVLFII